MRVLVLCVVLALGVLGCQQAQETVEEAETMLEEGQAKVEEVVEGAKDMLDGAPMIDPVCGMEVTKESEWTAEFEGVTFYFCCEDCRDKFVETPDKFMEKLEEMKDKVEEVLPT